MIYWKSKELGAAIVDNADVLDTSAIHYPTVEEVFKIAKAANPVYLIFAATDGLTDDEVVVTNDLYDSSIKTISEYLETYNSVLLSNRIEHCKEVTDILESTVAVQPFAYERLRESVCK